MNTKKLIGTSMIALLVVALSVSVAAAENIHITPPASTDLIPGGASTSYTMVLDEFFQTSSTHYIESTIVNPSGSTDLEFQFVYGTSPSGWLESGATWSWGPPSTDPATIMMNVRAKSGAPINTQYYFKVVDNDGCWDEASATTKASSSIPEFATLAIPVVALLGLVLFMRRKKD